VEDVATPEAFSADPEMVWQFYSERRQRHETVLPNPAHFALAELERALRDRFFGGIAPRGPHARATDAVTLLASDVQNGSVR
jgi:hypothetical protein